MPSSGLPGDVSSLCPFIPPLSDWNRLVYSTLVGFSFRLPEGFLHNLWKKQRASVSVVFDYSIGPIGFSSALSMKRYAFLVLGVEDGHNALVYRLVDRSDLHSDI